MSFLLSPFRNFISSASKNAIDFSKSIQATQYNHPPLQSTLETSMIKENPASFKPTIPRKDYLCALCCRESYKTPESRARIIDLHYQYDNQLSNDRIAVYVHNFLTGQVIIAIRGTRLTDLRDIQADIDIIFAEERNNTLIQEIISQVNQVLIAINNKYDIQDDTVWITGHSLGGLIACYVCENLQSECITFNIGISPSQLSNKKVFENPRIISYVMTGDPISVSSSIVIENTITLNPRPRPNNPLESHSLEFLINSCQPNFPIRNGIETNSFDRFLSD